MFRTTKVVKSLAAAAALVSTALVPAAGQAAVSSADYQKTQRPSSSYFMQIEDARQYESRNNPTTVTARLYVQGHYGWVSARDRSVRLDVIASTSSWAAVVGSCSRTTDNAGRALCVISKPSWMGDLSGAHLTARAAYAPNGTTLASDSMPVVLDYLR